MAMILARVPWLRTLGNVVEINEYTMHRLDTLPVTSHALHQTGNDNSMIHRPLEPQGIEQNVYIDDIAASVATPKVVSAIETVFPQ